MDNKSKNKTFNYIDSLINSEHKDNNTILEQTKKDFIEQFVEVIYGTNDHADYINSPTGLRERKPQEILDFITKALLAKEDEFKMLITKEMGICYKEGTPTSRLTSLFNKIK